MAVLLLDTLEDAGDGEASRAHKKFREVGETTSCLGRSKNQFAMNETTLKRLSYKKII